MKWWQREWHDLIEPVLAMARSEPAIIEEVSDAWNKHPESIHLAKLYWELAQRHEDVIQQCIIKWLGRNELRELVAALELLQRMGPDASHALPSLCDLLKVDFWLYPFYSLQVIERIGPAAKAALGEIIKTMRTRYNDDRSPDMMFRHVYPSAARTLGKILPNLSNLESTLHLIIDNPYVRERIALAPVETESLDDLVRMLERICDRLNDFPKNISEDSVACRTR